MQSAVRQCGWLTAVIGAVWLLLAFPAYRLAEARGLEGLSYAAILCLVPGWLVFWLGSRYGVANARLNVVLSGTALRVLFVLAGALWVRFQRPDLGLLSFFVWLVVFYLVALLVETLLVVKQTQG